MPLSATQSRIRARSSSSRRKRRRTGSRSARSSTSEAVRRRLARSSSWATTPSTGLVWRSERSARRTRRSVGRSSSGSGSSSSSSTTSPAPNVAWMSGANVSMSGHITITSRGCSVSSSSSRWRIASRRTSTWRARPWQAWIWTLRSARIERRAGVGGAGERDAGRGAVGAHVGLDAAEQRVLGELDRVVVIDVLVRAEHELHLARVLAPGGEQPVGGERRRWCRRRGARPAAGPPIFSHSAGEGCRRKTWTSRPAASARSTSRWPVGSRVSPNSEMRSGRSSSDGLRAQPLARGLEPLGRARRAEPLAQPPPQLRLPRGLVGNVDLAARPAAHHRRAVQRVAVEQLGEVADGREAARAPVRVVLVAQVAARGCAATARSRHSPTTSSSGQTARCGSHGSDSGSIPDAAATASPASRRGNGNSTFAQMPSERPGVAPRLADIRCVSQRSIPRVGTAMTSGANGSASGSASRRPSASIRASARSARWMWSTRQRVSRGQAHQRARRSPDRSRASLRRNT